MAENSGLAQRGLLLLGFMVVIVAAFSFVLLRGPQQQVPTESHGPEPLIALVCVPTAGLPGAVCWAALGELGEMLPSARGWEVRYNAVVALARRGSAHLPFAVLAEMLDEQRQMRNFRARLQDGRNVPDEAAARRTVLNALKAVVEWHKHSSAVQAVGGDNAGLRKVYAAVDRLTRSPNLVVRTEAENVRLSLRKS